MMRAGAIALLLLTAAAAQSAPAVAQQSAPPAASGKGELPPNAFTTGVVRADARQLAELLMPADLYLAMIRRVALAGFDEAAKTDLADVEAEHPGLVQALRTELTALAVGDEEKSLGAMYDRYARALGSAFSPADVAALSEFYGSRTGRKVITSKFEGLDVSGLLSKLDQQPDAAVTAADITAINQSATAQLIGQLDIKDQEAFAAFSKTPAFAKLASWIPTMTMLEAQIASEPDPELDAEMEAVINRVMRRFGIDVEI